MSVAEFIGWASSALLVVTLSKQVYKQWHEGTSEGVSKWLFIGQVAASLGFLVYSLLIWNPVFIVTNSLMVLNAVFGIFIIWRHRH